MGNLLLTLERFFQKNFGYWVFISKYTKSENRKSHTLLYIDDRVKSKYVLQYNLQLEMKKL